MQGTRLYASELTWDGNKGVEGEYQRAISRMGRSMLGAFRSTPLESSPPRAASTHQGAPEPPTGQVHATLLRQITGGRGPGGDPHKGIYMTNSSATAPPFSSR